MTTNALATGFWSAQSANNARQGRALAQSLFVAASTNSPLSTVRSGVIPTVSDGTYAYDLRVTVASGLSMTVQPGSAVIGRSGQGGYITWNLPAADTVTCDPAPTTNPRNDIVILRVYDVAQGDTVPASGSIAQVEIITGSPAAIPTDPVGPDSTGLISNWSGLPVPAQGNGGGVAIPLARAQVSTGGVITLTDIRRGTSPIGGVRVLLPGDKLTDPSYMPGDISWYNGHRYWDGTAWHGIKTNRYPRIAATGSGASASFTGTINTSYTLASVSIPDPGFPYQVKVSGSIFLSGMSNSSGGVSHQFGAMVDTATLVGPSAAPTANTVGSMFVGQTNSTFANPAFVRTNPTVYTGAHTVYLILQLGSQGPATWGPLNQRSDYEFAVEAIPA
ncbi:hypothetical protein ATK30_6861 [Amycolatopsis echigonensis]|uniref:Minor tail protein n=1 Tax=Amycolatopsis echigonensis TaxID=2576905 RepID=A0A2N3WPX6_9PSEU|nr:hypothetical protein [Amycolatopsis niigatensis]PKV95928.1 hypothetical protein ATK30_6861 [Amycolatopsis niigatensis]